MLSRALAVLRVAELGTWGQVVTAEAAASTGQHRAAPAPGPSISSAANGKGKDKVPMGTESADISKLKKERSSKVCAQRDCTDMGGWVYFLSPSSVLEGKIL